MRTVVYRLELEQPALLTALQGDPNSATSLEYVPGSAIRGAVVGRYVAGGGRVDAADAGSRALFFDGTTCFLNAYPLDRLERRSLPTPRSWRRRKGGGETIVDTALAPADDEADGLVHGPPWVAVGAPFCTIRQGDAAAALLVAPLRHIAVHTSRTRRYGRAMPASLAEGDTPGAVFRYDALAGKQTFGGAVVCHEDAHADDLRDLLTAQGGLVWLGRSKSAEYGRARFVSVEIVEEGWDEVAEAGGRADGGATDSVVDEAWSEEHGAWESPVSTDDAAATFQGEVEPGSVPATPDAADAEAPPNDEELTITLLSDALVRDEQGHVAADAEALARAVGMRVGARFEVSSGFTGTGLVAGFNRTWGLPLPQAPVVAMGSAVTLRGPRLSAEQIGWLETYGVGERRAEGFGRVAVGWCSHWRLSLDSAVSAPVAPITPPLAEGTEAARLALRMAERRLRQDLDRRLTAAVQRHRIEHPPTHAQLARVRAILRAELVAGTFDTARVVRFLDDVEQRAAARRQFVAARVTPGPEPLLAWLRRLSKLVPQEWDAVFAGDRTALDVRVAGLKAEIGRPMAAEYLLRFFDGVLGQAAKREES